ncbi:hypothetical protein P4639_14465 [Priestia megaterium]|uniref:hypothetical protein n=1 Tax=Priestia megaterium TaxID=1404 RepID=UPI002E206DBA|nr:hypothetical protein [Priestia megaterium]
MSGMYTYLVYLKGGHVTEFNTNTESVRKLFDMVEQDEYLVSDDLQLFIRTNQVAAIVRYKKPEWNPRLFSNNLADVEPLGE